AAQGIDRGGPAVDEVGAMTELGEDGVEHHPAIRIVFGAENAQRPALAGRDGGLGGLALSISGAARKLQLDREREARSAARRALDRQPAAHRLGDPFHEDETEAGAAEAPRHAGARLREGTHQPLALSVRQADAAVRHCEHELAAMTARPATDAAGADAEL